jgi:hypothetical protein
MSAAPTRATDSPWFWVYLFGAAALIAMFLIGQKADTVQAQRDGNFTRRQASLERQSRRAGEATPSVLNGKIALTPEDLRPPLAESETEEPRYVQFNAFYAILGTVTVFAWVMHWRQRLLSRSAASQSPA